jgi:hypothetical protein
VILRNATCLLLLLAVVLASLCLVPFGQGPSSLAYGPSTALRAYRAAMELRCALSVMIAVLIAGVLGMARLAYRPQNRELLPPVFDLPLLISTLRC